MQIIYTAKQTVKYPVAQFAINRELRTASPMIKHTRIIHTWS